MSLWLETSILGIFKAINISLCMLLRYHFGYGSLARYVTLQVAHAPGMPGTFFPPPQDSDPDMHHGTCVTHVPWCMSGSLTSGFLWSRWRGKRSRHSRCMRNPQFYVSGKRPIATTKHMIISRIISCLIYHDLMLSTPSDWTQIHPNVKMDMDGRMICLDM